MVIRLMKKSNSVLSNNLFMLKEVIGVIPLYVIGTFCLTIARAIVNAYVNVYLIKYVVDAIQFKAQYQDILVSVFWAAAAFLLHKLLESGFINILAPKMTQKLNYSMQMSLFCKAREIDIEKYDQPQFYNDFILSMQNADAKAIDVVDTINTLIYNLTSISAMVAIIASIDTIGLVFALINVTFAYFINIKTAKTNYKKELELVPPRRLGEYVRRVFYLPEYAKEIRMSNIKNVLVKNYKLSVDESKGVIKKYSRLLTALNFTNYGFFRTFLMRGVYLIILAYRLVIQHSVSFGEFLALYNGSWEFKNNLEAIINIVPRIVENSMYIAKYRAFVTTESAIKKIAGNDPLPAKPSKIEFRNVSFRYSENSGFVLKNINLVIEPYEKLAIYGLNGAGKTTLIKLLLRLYMPTEGEILLDGKNINTYSLKDYYKYIGVVFQDFQLFSFSIAENVLLDKYLPEDEQKVTEALEILSFDNRLSKTSQGIATLVSKEFDSSGVDFSGGERQKIALARTMVRDFSILIFDEPASALDPISEYEVNKAIWQSTKGKTVICISHRINANVKADRTIYMRDGQIVDDSELKAIYQ